MTGIILAGGSNRRFPIPKSLIKVSGQRIIERTIGIFQGLFRDTLISTNTPDILFYLRRRMIGDIYPSTGPLTGIFSTLLNISTEHAFVVACDMPFIRQELIEYIIGVQTKASVVVCRWGGIIHPLFGIYSRGIINEIEQVIRQGNISLLEFIENIDTHIVEEGEIKNIDPKGESFVNINTPDDFNKYIGGRICLD